MAFVLNRGKISVMTAKDDDTITSEEASRYREYVGQRSSHRPLAYILGTREFMGLDFEVNESTLIPRPETETVVEAALDIVNNTDVKTILEICTGSGCIAVSLAVHCPALDITASDISAGALRIAKRNAVRHGASIRFVQSDLFAGLDPRAYDMIIANPPYIPHDEINALPNSVKDYEPHAALDGGTDGLGFYRLIIPKTEKIIVLEIGYNQAKHVANILIRNNFGHIRIINDLAGHNRVITAQRNG